MTDAKMPDPGPKERRLDPEPRPVGSGYFAMAAAVVFIAAAAAVFLWPFKAPIKPTYILAGWLVACALIAGVWGANRINTGDSNNRRIGMDTINMIVTMVGVAFAIAALIKV